jgi:hypothetical protein
MRTRFKPRLNAKNFITFTLRPRPPVQIRGPQVSGLILFNILWFGMFKMPLFKIFCLLQLSSLVSSIVWNEPTQTAWRAEPVGNFVEQTAAPAAPALRRRDDPQGSICGYFPGELSM